MEQCDFCDKWKHERMAWIGPDGGVLAICKQCNNEREVPFEDVRGRNWDDTGIAPKEEA